MSHMVETMAWTGKTPWHGLGFEVSNDLTAPQMMKAAKLDWEVQKVPAFIELNGAKIDTGKSALVRSSDDKILDVVSHEWNPTQNETAFEFFREYVEAGHMKMETAGSLDGGRNVWALAKIESSFEAVRGDIVQSYLLFSNPHRFGRAINIRFTPIRVVCHNTLSFALEGAANSGVSVSVNHSKVFNPAEVKNTLAIALHKQEDYQETAAFLASKRATIENITEYLKVVFPKSTSYTPKNKKPEADNENTELSRPAQIALANLETQPGAEFGRGSWWQAFNAVTFATDHALGRSADSRLNSAWFGINQGRKIVALNQAVKYAKAA